MTERQIRGSVQLQTRCSQHTSHTTNSDEDEESLPAFCDAVSVYRRLPESAEISSMLHFPPLPPANTHFMPRPVSRQQRTETYNSLPSMNQSNGHRHRISTGNMQIPNTTSSNTQKQRHTSLSTPFKPFPLCQSK